VREGDAIAAARRRLPMVEVDANLELIGPNGPVTLLDAFEGRRQLIAYYFMWHFGRPAPEQCEGCTWVTTQVEELSYLHSRDITYAVFCQGPYEESARYREFMGWDMPWYSALPSLDKLLVGRSVGMMHIVCNLRDRGPRLRDLLDDPSRRRGNGLQLRADGPHRVRTPRAMENSPSGWPQDWQVDGSNTRINGCPIPQWSRLEAGRSDDLTTRRR
jgi:Bacterial protein of unknown function (DUF899)